jgi:uncharacterized protein (DUF2141 family)
MQHQSVILLAFCFLICYTGIAQINNISEDVKNSYDLTLNITNIKSKGNLMISIMTDSLAYSSNAFSSKTKSFKENIDKNNFTKIISLPKDKYLIQLYIDENLNDKMDTNFLGIPKEQYGFSSKEIIRFRKPNFDEASFDLKKNLTIDITL